MSSKEERQTVLIVDDSLLNIRVLSELLSTDYDILTSTSGEKALQIACTDNPDLIILDIVMPETDGYTICSRLKETEATKDIPVVFITAKADQKDEIKGFEAGAVDFITKPFNPLIVKARVKTHIMLKKYRDSLLQSEARYRLIAENTEDIIWLADFEQRVTYISPSIKIWGFTVEEAIKEPLHKIVDGIESILIKMRNDYRESNGRKQSPVMVELKQQGSAGQTIWIEVLINFARNDSGEIVGFLGVMRDISNRKLAERLLQYSYERSKRNDYFNQLLKGRHPSETELYEQAQQLRINIPQHSSLCFLKVVPPPDLEYSEKQLIMDSIVSILTVQGAVAWEAAEGIGILGGISDTDISLKGAEIKLAKQYLKVLHERFPESNFYIGIADYENGLMLIKRRFEHAQAAIKIGRKISKEEHVFYYDELSHYQMFAQFAASEDAEDYVRRTLGPLRNSRGDLLPTLEIILSHSSLKDAAEQMFLHYKTIQFRKHKIEKLLDVSLDSLEVRTRLLMAIQLLKFLQETQK